MNANERRLPQSPQSRDVALADCGGDGDGDGTVITRACIASPQLGRRFLESKNTGSRTTNDDKMSAHDGTEMGSEFVPCFGLSGGGRRRRIDWTRPILHRLQSNQPSIYLRVWGERSNEQTTGLAGSPELQKFEGQCILYPFLCPLSPPDRPSSFYKKPLSATAPVSYPVAASRDGATGIPLSGLCSQGAARPSILRIRSPWAGCTRRADR